MAHKAQTDFCKFIAHKYPEHFFKKRVLDVGSRDINGNNKYLLQDCSYIGCDARPGPNVDLVCMAHQLDESMDKFDLIISTEMLEHDPHWQESIRKCIALLNVGGAFLMTCATTGRPIHGIDTFSASGSYYRNIEKDEFLTECVGMNHLKTIVNQQTCDLYYFGVKNA